MVGCVGDMAESSCPTGILRIGDACGRGTFWSSLTGDLVGRLFCRLCQGRF